MGKRKVNIFLIIAALMSAAAVPAYLRAPATDMLSVFRAFIDQLAWVAAFFFGANGLEHLSDGIKGITFKGKE